MADFIFNLMNIHYCFTLKDVILYYENKSNKDLEFIVNLFILFAKFHIHKQTFLNSSPLLNLFCSDFDFYNNNNYYYFICNALYIHTESQSATD